MRGESAKPPSVDPQWARDLAALQAERDALAARLEMVEGWRALRQLRGRIAAADTPSAVSAAALEASLIAELAGNLDHRRLVVLDAEIGQLVAAGPPAPAPAPIEPTTPAVDPAVVTELMRIRGISRSLAERLALAGVGSLAAIAAWRPADVKAMSSALGLKREISRQNWIEQAARLMREPAPRLPVTRRRALPAVSPAADPSAKSAMATAVVTPAMAAAAAASATAPPSTVPAALPATAPALAEPHAFRPDMLTGWGAEHGKLIGNLDAPAALAAIARWTTADVQGIAASLTGGKRWLAGLGWIEQASLLAAGTPTAYARRLLAGEHTALVPYPAAVEWPVKPPLLVRLAAELQTPPPVKLSPQVAADPTARPPEAPPPRRAPLPAPPDVDEADKARRRAAALADVAAAAALALAMSRRATIGAGQASPRPPPAALETGAMGNLTPLPIGQPMPLAALPSSRPTALAAAAAAASQAMAAPLPRPTPVPPAMTTPPLASAMAPAQRSASIAERIALLQHEISALNSEVARVSAAGHSPPAAPAPSPSPVPAHPPSPPPADAEVAIVPAGTPRHDTTAPAGARQQRPERTSARTRRRRSDDRDLTDDLPASGESEAAVEIVPRPPRSSEPTPARPPPAAPPAAAEESAERLFDRLKRVQPVADFDGDSYAAYRDSVEEASVEIVRGPEVPRKPKSEGPVDPAKVRESRVRRFLKALGGE